MSTSFSGSSTRGMNDVEREIEKRVEALAASGNAKDQPALDAEDEAMHKDQAGIKPAKDQFPMSKINGPESLDKEVEKRLKKLSRRVVRRQVIDYAGVSAVTLSEDDGKFSVAKQTGHGLVDVAGGLDQVKAEEIWHKTIQECKNPKK